MKLYINPHYEITFIFAHHKKGHTMITHTYHNAKDKLAALHTLDLLLSDNKCLTSEGGNKQTPLTV